MTANDVASPAAKERDAMPSLGALSEAQMQDILVRAPAYRTAEGAPAVVHADAVQRLWGGRLVPLMAAADSGGRFAGAALTCPPAACTGLLVLADGAQSKVWRSSSAIENVFCFAGQVELRYGAALEHRLVLERFDMASVPAGVRHSIGNIGGGEARVVMVLNAAPGRSYEAVFDVADAEEASPANDALGVHFDSDPGLAVEAAAVAGRVTRFATLVPYKKTDSADGLSTEATEALTAGSVFTLIVPEGYVGRSSRVPMRGHEGVYLSIAECRSGDDGPPPHAHLDTQESFLILDGSFRIHTGFDKESTVAVGPGDLIALPTGVMRTFTNTSGRPARLLAIIQAPGPMRDAVAYSRRVGADFERRFGPQAIEAYRKKSMTFDAEDHLGL